MPGRDRIEAILAQPKKRVVLPRPSILDEFSGFLTVHAESFYYSQSGRFEDEMALPSREMDQLRRQLYCRGITDQEIVKTTAQTYGPLYGNVLQGPRLRNFIQNTASYFIPLP